MIKKKAKLLRVQYLERSEVKEHALKSKQGMGRWIREATLTLYKKEGKSNKRG